MVNRTSVTRNSRNALEGVGDNLLRDLRAVGRVLDCLEPRLDIFFFVIPVFHDVLYVLRFPLSRTVERPHIFAEHVEEVFQGRCWATCLGRVGGNEPRWPRGGYRADETTFTRVGERLGREPLPHERSSTSVVH
jgi:hypothetical protein